MALRAGPSRLQLGLSGTVCCPFFRYGASAVIAARVGGELDSVYSARLYGCPYFENNLLLFLNTMPIWMKGKDVGYRKEVKKETGTVISISEVNQLISIVSLMPCLMAISTILRSYYINATLNTATTQIIFS